MKKNIIVLLLLVGCLCAFTIPSQLMPTSLRVTVLNDAGNALEGAKVTLYATQEDYDKEQNPVGESVMTNAKGFATFRNLETKVYFMTVSKGDMDNAGASIKTESLKSGVLNKVNVIIE